MNIFEKFVYNIVKGNNCKSIDECPAVVAERAGQCAQEICAICEKCYDELITKKEKQMHKILNLQIINADCPKGMTDKDCPVQQYLKQQNVFRTTINETLLEPAKPYADAREEYISALDIIHQICANCRNKSK